MSNMPPLDPNAIADLTSAERELLALCVHKGQLRRTKPDVKLHHGRAAYLWRMLAFGLSPHRVHHCFPICADLDMVPPITAEETKAAIEQADAETDAGLTHGMPRNSQRRFSVGRVRMGYRSAWAKELNDLAVRIEKAVPLEHRQGTLAWARAFGRAPASHSVLP